MKKVIKLHHLTPLERITGVKFSESTYDLLEFDEQLILDLTISGWSQSDIAKVLDLSQSGINVKLRRIRFKLAEGELYKLLHARQHYKEISTMVITKESLEAL